MSWLALLIPKLFLFQFWTLLSYDCKFKAVWNDKGFHNGEWYELILIAEKKVLDTLNATQNVNSLKKYQHWLSQEMLTKMCFYPLFFFSFFFFFLTHFLQNDWGFLHCIFFFRFYSYLLFMVIIDPPLVGVHICKVISWGNSQLRHLWREDNR